MACEAKQSPFSSGDQPEEVPASEYETYYRGMFRRREESLTRAVHDSQRYHIGYTEAVKTAWFEICRCRSISKWICAFAHHNKMSPIRFVEIKEAAENQLEALLFCAVETAAKKANEEELRECTISIKEKYVDMIQSLRTEAWEASW